MILQRVLFSDKKWDVKSITKWLDEHHIKPIKLNHEGVYYHARINNPNNKLRYISKSLPNGIVFTFMIQ